MNIWDILILAVVAAAVFLAIRRVAVNRKAGCSCGCGADRCPHNRRMNCSGCEAGKSTKLRKEG